MPDLLLHEHAAPRALRLHVQDLPDGDVAKLALFMRLGSDRLAAAWSIADEGEAQVLVYEGDTPSTVPLALGSALQTLRVVDARAPGADAPGTLQRPLQYDDVLEALRAVELSLGVTAGVAVETACAAPPPASAPPPPVPVPAPTPPQATMPDEPAPRAALRRGDSYRLRRWPAAALIQQDRDHLRLASFLSARAIPLDDLARLANVAPAKCERFVSTLLALGIIDAKPAETRASAPRAASPASADRRAAPDARSVARPDGLFGRIRRKLGLVF